MKIAVIGASGLLGSDLMRVLENRVGFSSGDVDVRRPAETKTLIESDPDVIVNAAAYTRVNDAETNPDTAFEVNSIGSLNVARVAAQTGAICVYISTSMVFDGTGQTSCTEDDRPNPVNVYGTSKHAGEQLTANYVDNHYILRTSALYGQEGASDASDFVNTMIELGRTRSELSVVDDDVTSPTYTLDLARAIDTLLRKQPPFGVYNLANEGQISWYAFAEEIFAQLGIDVDVTPIPSEEYEEQVQRPKYTPLSIEKAATHGITLRPWKAALDAYLDASDHR